MPRHFGFHEPKRLPVGQCFAIWVVLDLISIGLIAAIVFVVGAILKFSGIL